MFDDVLITKNLSAYIKLYDEYDDSKDPNVQDEIQEKIENIWFDLNDDEIAYIEINNLNI